MKLDKWWPLYSRIVQDFSFDPSKDFLSSLLLSEKLGGDSSFVSFEKLRGKKVNIVGNGPSLHEIVESISTGISIVADSALDSYFPSKGCPEFIVTDLDGNLELIRSCGSESTIVVHAHGDNLNGVRGIEVSNFSRLCATTQNIPLWNVLNWGGFTDGDRSAFLADEFGARTITLVAFDFKRPGRKGGDQSMKLRKLEWAKMLLADLASSRYQEFRQGDFIDI